MGGDGIWVFDLEEVGGDRGVGIGVDDCDQGGEEWRIWCGGMGCEMKEMGWGFLFYLLEKKILGELVELKVGYLGRENVEFWFQ